MNKYCKKCGYDTAGDKCPLCGCSNFYPPCNISYNDVKVISKISNDDSFFLAMNELKGKDVIEYELKMSQFRNQLKQQDQNKLEPNKPKCPHCSSINIASIGTAERIGSIAFLGIFSKMINKSFKCNSCGYTW